MAVKDKCYCSCGLPASRTSAFRNKHMKRWLDELVDQCLPDAIDGRSVDHITEPHRAILDQPSIRPMFAETLERRVRYARRGWPGQQGALIEAPKIGWLMRNLRDRYWTGNDVYHATLGYGKVVKVIDQANVRVAFDMCPETTWEGPTAKLTKPNVDPHEDEA